MGKVLAWIRDEERPQVFRNDFLVNLIDFKDSDYFDTLRTKMGWGKRG